jgi:hypothetical protein
LSTWRLRVADADTQLAAPQVLVAVYWKKSGPA